MADANLTLLPLDATIPSATSTATTATTTTTATAFAFVAMLRWTCLQNRFGGLMWALR